MQVLKQKKNKVLGNKIVIGGFLCALLFISHCTKNKNDTVLVKIGHENISVKDFEKKLNEYQLDLSILGSTEKKEMKKMLIHELIEEKALLMEARKRYLKISDEELFEEKKNKDLIFSGEKELPETLIMTKTELDQKIRQHMLLEKVQLDLTKNVVATEEELEIYFKNNKRKFERKRQYDLEMLETKHEAEAIKAYKIIGEEGFSTLNINVDVLDVQYRASKWYARDLLPKIILSFAKDAKADSISSILKSPYGFHIVKLNRVRPAYIPNFKDIKDEISSILLEKKKEKVLLDWKQDFLSETKIERNDALIEKI